MYRDGGKGGGGPGLPEPTGSTRRWQEELQPATSSGELVALIVLDHWKDLRAYEVTQGFTPSPRPCLITLPEGRQLPRSACLVFESSWGRGGLFTASLWCWALPLDRSLPLMWTPSAWPP